MSRSSCCRCACLTSSPTGFGRIPSRSCLLHSPAETVIVHEPDTLRLLSSRQSNANCYQSRNSRHMLSNTGLSTNSCSSFTCNASNHSCVESYQHRTTPPFILNRDVVSGGIAAKQYPRPNAAIPGKIQLASVSHASYTALRSFIYAQDFVQMFLVLFCKSLESCQTGGMYQITNDQHEKRKNTCTDMSCCPSSFIGQSGASAIFD